MSSSRHSRISELTRESRPLVLTGGRILDPSQNIDEPGDLLVQNGKVEAVGGRVGHPDGAEVIDRAGCIVSPGFIDVHCLLREPGREDVETLATRTHAAAGDSSARVSVG